MLKKRMFSLRTKAEVILIVALFVGIAVSSVWGTVTLTEVHLDENRVASPEGLGQLSEGSTATVTVSGIFTTGQTVEIKIVCEDDIFTLMTDTVQF